MKYKKGSVLLYTLTIFLSFCIWFEGVLLHRIKKTERTFYIEMIQRRLSDQRKILDYFRNECEFDEDNPVCKYEILGDVEVYFIWAEEYNIEVFNEYGKSLKKYDIMGDGSVIETITEETL